MRVPAVHHIAPFFADRRRRAASVEEPKEALGDASETQPQVAHLHVRIAICFWAPSENIYT